MMISNGPPRFDGQDGFQTLSGISQPSPSQSPDEKSALFMMCTPTEGGATKDATLDEKTLHDGIDSQPKNWPRTCLYHMRTLWLFTQSDMKSMIYPNIILGLSCRVSRRDLALGHDENLIDIFGQIPYIFVWLWFNLLLFNLANQRLPSSIMEDSINKPWRPIPSGRIDANRANILVCAVIPVVLLVSVALGATIPALALMALTLAYNDLGGADKSFVTRNLLNAFGMSIYSSGAIIVASGNRSGLTVTATQWVAFLGLVVATTIHVQDMKDQEGDAIRERKTLPLVMGDRFARWAISGTIMGWSLATPTFWRVGVEGYLPTAIVGVTITFRILWLRNVEADKKTWAFWCLDGVAVPFAALAIVLVRVWLMSFDVVI